MAGVVEGLISDLVARGVERLAARKRLTSQDLTVLLLYEHGRGLREHRAVLHGQGDTLARIEAAVESIANEVGGLRRDIVPLLSQARDIAETKSRLERIESRTG